MFCNAHYWSISWSRGWRASAGYSISDLKAARCSLIDVVYVPQVRHSIILVKKQMYTVWYSHVCCTCGCQIIHDVIERDTQRPVVWEKC